MLKHGDIAFAKVRGHSPWPAKILNNVSRSQFKVFFFGTNQEGIVKETQVWNYDENLKTFSSKYGSRRLYATALEQVKQIRLKRQAKLKSEEVYETKELVFAKVKGYSPWPAQIQEKTGPKMYNVFFFGTSQTGRVQQENIWNYDTTCEEFTAKYGKRKPYALALKQIGEISRLASPKSTKKNASSRKKTSNLHTVASGMSVVVFVDDETVPNISNLKVGEDNDVAMLMNDEVYEFGQSTSNCTVSDDKDIEKPIPMFEDDLLGFNESATSETKAGSYRRILRDRSQYDIIPELSKNRNDDIKDSEKEQNTLKENLSHSDIMCTEDLKPQEVVLKSAEEPTKLDKRNILANNLVFSKVPRPLRLADINVGTIIGTSSGLTRNRNTTSKLGTSGDKRKSSASILESNDVTVPKEKIEGCKNDDPVVVFDNRTMDIPTEKLDKDDECSVAVLQNRHNKVKKTEASIDHTIEEIPRNDLVIKITGFSITRTVCTCYSQKR